MLISPKLAVKIPLGFENDLDCYVKKDLRPLLLQTPTLYSNIHLISGVIIKDSDIYLSDTLGSLYLTSLTPLEVNYENPIVMAKDILKFTKNEQE